MKLNAYIYAHKPNDHAYESNIYSHYAVLRLPGSKEPALPRGLCGGHSGRSAFFTSARLVCCGLPFASAVGR